MLLAAAALGGGQSSAPGHAAALVRQEAAATVLYRWKLPAKGHVGSWNFSRGTATYDGESIQPLLAPFALHHVANFAIQASMQGMGPGGPEATLVGFGLVVRQAPNDPHTSIEGGSFVSKDPENNGPDLYWNGDTVGGAAFDPRRSWHVYRLEVHAGEYTLLIDGKELVAYRIDDYPNPTRVGVFSDYYKVRVKDFTVFALAPLAQPVTTFPPTKQFALTLADLPPTTFYQPTLRHYYLNEEYAREHQLTAAALNAAGRIVSYGVDYYTTGANLIDIYNTVVAFRTPTDAAADVPVRLAAFRQDPRTSRNYHALPPDQVGDTSGGFSFDVAGDGLAFTLLVLYFQRGSYDVLVRLTTQTTTGDLGKLQEQAVNLARIVDRRIQQAP